MTGEVEKLGSGHRMKEGMASRAQGSCLPGLFVSALILSSLTPLDLHFFLPHSRVTILAILIIVYRVFECSGCCSGKRRVVKKLFRVDLMVIWN